MPIIPPFLELPGYMLGFNYIRNVDAGGIKLIPLSTLEKALDLFELFGNMPKSLEDKIRYDALDDLPVVTIDDTMRPSEEATKLYEKSIPFALYVKRPDSGRVKEGMIDFLERRRNSILNSTGTMDLVNGKVVDLTPDLKKRIENYFGHRTHEISIS